MMVKFLKIDAGITSVDQLLDLLNLEIYKDKNISRIRPSLAFVINIDIRSNHEKHICIYLNCICIYDYN